VTVSTRTADYLETIEHLPEGATLVVRDVTWDDYERLMGQIIDRAGVRVSYDDGRLEIVTTSTEHEEYKEVILLVARVFCEERDITLESRGSATWKRRALQKGVEPDTCFYVANAGRIIGKRTIDLETDPPPDIAVEIDVTRDSSRKFSISAALGVPELWRYDGTTALFYELDGGSYRITAGSRFLPGLTPSMLADALDHSKREGQTVALATFRRRLRSL
jgi:Uma2 family endonuclease